MPKAALISAPTETRELLANARHIQGERTSLLKDLSSLIGSPHGLLPPQAQMPPLKFIGRTLA
jgi:hypothetical protein